MDKEAFKKEMVQLLQNFFQEEQGNRITSNNIEGLSGKIFNLINKLEPDPSKKRAIPEDPIPGDKA